MRNLFFISLLLFVGCVTTQPTSSPPAQSTKIVYKHDTILLPSEVLHDTIKLNAGVTIYSDTCVPSFPLDPIVGDSYQMIQDAIDFCINTGVKLLLRKGDFYISRPLIIARIINGVYKQSSIAIEGVISPKNSSGGYARIFPMFSDAFAIGIQQGKGISIKNIALEGKYTRARGFNALQVDTLSFADWGDGVCSENVSSVYAGIAVDFASDPASYDGVKYKMYPGLEKYYLPGMNRGGSTAITFDGLSIQNFIVGLIVTPSNQANGEIIHLYHSQIQNVKVAYALCQAQSKQCEVRDLEVWGQCHTVFDNVTYGFRHGDGAGSPAVDGVNLAGLVHQIFNMQNYTFPASFNNVYAESLFKLGQIGGWAGANLTNFSIDFTNKEPGYPSPDFYLFGINVIHYSCGYRLYPGTMKRARIILNNKANTFYGGYTNEPPICTGVDGINSNPTFINMSMYYPGTNLNRNNYDSIRSLTKSTNVFVDRSTFSGYFLNDTSGIKTGDVILTSKIYEDQFSNVNGTAYPVGFVSRLGKDTVYLENVGVGIHNGDVMSLWINKTKNYN